MYPPIIIIILLTRPRRQASQLKFTSKASGRIIRKPDVASGVALALPVLVEKLNEQDEPGGSPPRFDCLRVHLHLEPSGSPEDSHLMYRCERSEPRFTALPHILGAPPRPTMRSHSLTRTTARRNTPAPNPRCQPNTAADSSDVLCRPTTVCAEGHTFCAACVEASKQQPAFRCPICRCEPLTAFTLNRPIQNMTRQASATCRHHFALRLHGIRV